MNQSPSQTTHLFTNRQITAMLLPLMAEQLLITLMGMVNTFMVAHVGSYAISAVSLVDSINILVIQAFYALSTGGTIVCAQYLGQKKTGHAIRSAEQTLFIVTLISLVTAAFCILFDRQILRLIFGTVDEEVFNSARTYFFYSSLSYPFIALYDAGSSIFRAQKNTGFPMAMSLIANIANVIGNIILVLILGQGVAGAAISTLAARALCALLVLLRLVKPRENQPVYVANYTRIRPHMPLIRRILHIGIPAGIENSMFQFGKLAIQSTVSTLGTAAIAANAVTNILENLNGVAAQGVGIGLMTIVGQCIGAGRKDEAIYYIKKLSKMAEAAIIISCLVVFALCRPITILGGMEAESARMCFEMTLFITITKPISWVLSFIPAYGMRAAGDVKFSMITSCASMWLCRVSFTIFLCRVYGFGPIAVWIGMFADWTVRGIIFTIRFHSRRWLNHHIID